MLHNSKTPLQKGAQAEAYVAQWLIDQGFSIIETNYRQRCGEIDLIVSCPEYIIFVEVKARTHMYCSASELVPYSKQKRITKAAHHYLAYNNIHDKVIRFDVAIVHGHQYHIDYFPNAFVLEHE